MRAILAFVLGLSVLSGAWPQSDEDLFSNPEAGTSAPGVVSATSDVTGRFLGGEQKTTLSGEFRGSAAAVWKDADPALDQSLSLNLGLTARPDTDVRIGAKGQWSYNPGNGKADVRVQEAFADFQGADQLYFRVGKQFISWGKGYFYSPADVLSLSQIDPSDPKAYREGPTALKASWEAGPWGSYQGVVSTDGVAAGSQVRWAGMGNWVWGGVEWGLGGFFQQQGNLANRVFTTTGFNLLDVQFYTESVLLTKDNAPATQQTIGFSCNKQDAERRWTLTALGQYYFDGSGANNAHYAAGSLGLSKLWGSTVSVSASGRASLSEGTWGATPRVSWVATPDLTWGAQVQGTEASATWQGDALLFSHLSLAWSGPVPGSDNQTSPQLKVSVSGLSF